MDTEIQLNIDPIIVKLITVHLNALVGSSGSRLTGFVGVMRKPYRHQAPIDARSQAASAVVLSAL